jgi:protein-S-isoprenylcysteine O-methyltransferase Ste14
VAVFEALTRRGRVRARPPGLALMLAGWLLYSTAGRYRRARAGGRGMRSLPAALVTTGPYANTRNPMYLGHLVFTAGLLLATRSPLALALLVERWLRFSRRVEADEQRLSSLFGDRYEAYRRAVPRWLPRL